MKEQRRGVIWALILMSALAAAGFAAIAVVEVLFLKYDLGASFSLIGSILGPAAVGYIVFASLIRDFARSLGAARFLLWGSLLLACAAIWSSLLWNPALYLPAKIILSMVGAVYGLVLLDAVDDHFRFTRVRGSVLASLTVASLLGGSVGAFLSGMLARSSGLPAGYALAAGCFSLAAMLVVVVPNKQQLHRRSTTRHHPLQHLTDLITSRYALIAGLVFSAQFFWVIRDFALPVLVVTRDHTVYFVGLIFAVGSIVGLLSFLLARYLLSMNEAPQVILACMFFTTIGAFLLAVSSDIMLVVSMAFFGLGAGGLTASIADLVRQQASSDEAEDVMVALGTVGGFAWLVAPLLVGIFLEAGVSVRVILIGAALVISYGLTAAQRKWSKQFFPSLTWRKKLKFDWK